MSLKRILQQKFNRGYTLLTLKVPRVTNIDFLQTTAADHHEKSLWELITKLIIKGRML